MNRIINYSCLICIKSALLEFNLILNFPLTVANFVVANLEMASSSISAGVHIQKSIDIDVRQLVQQYRNLVPPIPEPTMYYGQLQYRRDIFDFIQDDQYCTLLKSFISNFYPNISGLDAASKRMLCNAAHILGLEKYKNAGPDTFHSPELKCRELIQYVKNIIGFKPFMTVKGILGNLMTSQFNYLQLELPVVNLDVKSLANVMVGLGLDTDALDNMIKSEPRRRAQWMQERTVIIAYLSKFTINGKGADVPLYLNRLDSSVGEPELKGTVVQRFTQMDENDEDAHSFYNPTSFKVQVESNFHPELNSSFLCEEASWTASARSVDFPYHFMQGFVPPMFQIRESAGKGFFIDEVRLLQFARQSEVRPHLFKRLDPFVPVTDLSYLIANYAGGNVAGDLVNDRIDDDDDENMPIAVKYAELARQIKLQSQLQTQQTMRNVNEEDEEEEEEDERYTPRRKVKSASHTKPKKSRKIEMSSESESEDEYKPKKHHKRKRKAESSDEDDEEEEEYVAPKRRRLSKAPSRSKAPSKKKQKVESSENEEEDDEEEAAKHTATPRKRRLSTSVPKKR